MIYHRRALLASLIACAGLATVPALALAADAYPAQPITLVVPFQPGGGTDAVARSFAKAAEKHFPKGMIVLNKSGAGGAVRSEERRVGKECRARWVAGHASTK